ncbi:hypothetical protein [Sphingobacterium prati]|uniref:hypothetical protein n=1 Tax=Sphingobacterium prati TaxID=2737006 RepID=UPI00155255C9|nr:hypothetical protein [Sphingobacterium prati]NPE48869.1 hypothetical protein [Sphingobacterium prati]
MKNTQKKLKAKHFRYLSKEYIEDPLKYLEDFYEQETYHHYFVMEINLLINAASNVKMNCPNSSLGYNTKKLITFVEIAYVIFKKCNLKKLKNPLNFIQCVSDYWNYVSGECFSVNDIESPEDEISRFFSHQSLGQWYETLDEIWINISDRNGDFLGNEGNNILAVRELLQRLAISLHKIYENKSLPDSIANNQEEIEHEESQDQKSLEQTNSIETKEEPFDDVAENEILNPKERIILPAWLAPHPYSISALKNFFDRDDLNGWKEDIRYWYRTVITENEFWSADNENHKFSGANLLYTYSCICSLLEMLFNKLEESPISLMDIESSISILPECQSIFIRHENKEIILYYISDEELRYPLSSLLATVNTYSQQQWDEILYDWVNYGLDKNRYTGDYSDYSTRIYQTIIKIIELAYLVAFSDEIDLLNPNQTAPIETEI